MYLTRKSLPRRTFLRGLGVAVGLPLLDAMVPPLTAFARTPAVRPLRFGAVYVPNGIIMEQWTPAAVGADFEFTPILRSLEPFRDSLVIVSNLSRPGTADSHAVASAGWLSGATAKRTEGEDFILGTTIDQVIARHIGKDGAPFPSIEVATEDFAGYVGGCDPGYACAYMNTLSWTASTTPLPMEINPRVLFERMFGRPGTAAQRQARRQLDRSILDSIAQEVKTLDRGLGASDRARLGQYLDHVREIERRIQQTEARNSSRVVAATAPLGVPESYTEHAGLMFELLALAFEADLTRVATFMMAREASFRTYPEIAVTEPHHSLSHHGNQPDKIAEHAKINAYHVGLFATFIERLQTTQDGDGTLLDHALIVYGSGMSNGHRHSAEPLPMLALGGGAGRGNRHVQLSPKTPVGDLWVGVAERFGCELERLGDSRGRVEL